MTPNIYSPSNIIQNNQRYVMRSSKTSIANDGEFFITIQFISYKNR